MNSFKQLNGYGEEFVTFQSQADYSIEFGASLGNATVIANVSVAHNLQNRQLIASFDNPLLPLVVQINSPDDENGVAVTDINYSGPNGNIVVENVNDNQWLIKNIQTVADYNEIFNNTSVSINSLRTENFAYQTVVSDQLDNLRTFFTNVEVVPFGFSRPTSVTYNEDQSANITGLAITDISNLNYTFTFSLVPTDAGNIRLNSNEDTGNTIVVSSSRDQLNQAFETGITYIPADDYDLNSNVSVSVFNNSSNTSVGTSNIQLLIGESHADFSVPASIGYSETANSNVGTTTTGNIRITDQAVNRQYTSTVTLQNSALGDLYNGNTLLGNTVIYSGNISQVNNNLANVKFVPVANAVVNSNIIYNQVQTTAGITQAANIQIPLSYQIPAIHINSGISKPVGLTVSGRPSAWKLENFNGRAVNMLFVQSGANVAPATSDVDYWAWPNYTNLNAFRDTDNFVFQPMGIKLDQRSGTSAGIVARNFGIIDRDPEDSNKIVGTAGYFSFWIYLNETHSYSHYCAIAAGRREGNVGSGENWLGIGSYNSNMFITSNATFNGPVGGTDRGEPVIRNFQTNNVTRFRERIALGSNPPVGVWTHIAIQISAGIPATVLQGSFSNPSIPSDGTQVVSVWRDGVPITQFFGRRNTGFNGLTWPGKINFNALGRDKTTNQLNEDPGFAFAGPITTWREDPIDGSQSFGQRPNIIIDDVYLAGEAIRNDLEPFTPVAKTFDSTALGLLTGV